MKKVILILILVISALSSQAQFITPIATPAWYHKFKVDQIFWLATSDTTGYAAATYPGALAFQQIEGDTAIYYSNGAKWVPVGSTQDLSGYALKDSVYFRHYIDSILTTKQDLGISYTKTETINKISDSTQWHLLSGGIYHDGPISMFNIPSGNPATDFPLSLKSDGTVRKLSPGGLQRVILTSKSTLDNLISLSQLAEGSWYKISDATSSDITVYAFATSSSNLDSNHVIVPGYTYASAYYSPFRDDLTLIDRLDGVIRCTNGVWSFVRDMTHNEENFDSVFIDSSSATYPRIEVTYKKQGYYTEVGNLIAQADNDYAYYNVYCAASVSTDHAWIDMYMTMNVQDSIYYNTAAAGFRFSNQFASSQNPIDSIITNTDSTATIYHSFNFYNNREWLSTTYNLKKRAVPIVSPLYGGYSPIVKSYTDTSVTVAFFNGPEKQGINDSCKFLLSRSQTNVPIADYKKYASEHNTNIWIQGWMRKVIN